MSRSLLSRVAISALLAAGLAAGPATTVAPVTAVDAEPDACVDATTPTPLNAWLDASLDSATDVDWFLFQKTASSGVLATLGQLPGNDRLALYAACTAILASSDQAGNGFEEIYRSLPPGEYRLRVSHVAGPTGAYRLRLLERSVCGWLSYRTWTELDGSFEIAGEVLNAYAEDVERAFVTVNLKDSAGGPLGYFKVGTTFEDIAPGTRGAFRGSLAQPPAGLASVWVTSSCRPHPGAGFPTADLPIVTWATTIDLQGRRHFTGTVRNDTTRMPDQVNVVVTLYDPIGRVANAGRSAVTPMGPSTVGTFDIVLDDHHQANRVRLVVEAIFPL